MIKINNPKRTIFSTTLFFMGLLFVIMLHPLPKASLGNCQQINGEVSEIIEGVGEYDIVVKMKGDDNYYYINRGLESGLDIDKLQNQLINQEISLYYIKHWSPLDFGNKTKHIARIDFQEMEVYNEM